MRMRNNRTRLPGLSFESSCSAMRYDAMIACRMTTPRQPFLSSDHGDQTSTVSSNSRGRTKLQAGQHTTWSSSPAALWHDGLSSEHSLLGHAVSHDAHINIAACSLARQPSTAAATTQTPLCFCASYCDPVTSARPLLASRPLSHLPTLSTPLTPRTLSPVQECPLLLPSRLAPSSSPAPTRASAMKPPSCSHTSCPRPPFSSALDRSTTVPMPCRE